jgi:TatD DNase family protein
VVGKLVDIYKKDFAEIDRITSENAHKIFGKQNTSK